MAPPGQERRGTAMFGRAGTSWFGTAVFGPVEFGKFRLGMVLVRRGGDFKVTATR